MASSYASPRVGALLERLARSDFADPFPAEIPLPRIAIIEPNLSKAELLCYACARFWGFEVVALETAGRSGISAVRRTSPELVLAAAAPIDLSLQSFVSELRDAAIAAKLIFFASHYTEYFLHTVSCADYHGLIYEPDENLHSLAQAIGRVRAGHRFTSQKIAAAQASLRKSPLAFPKLLTDREIQVLQGIAHSLSDEEIADLIGCRAGTILAHRRELMRKLNIHSTPKLIRYSIDRGFDAIPVSEIQLKDARRPCGRQSVNVPFPEH